MRALAITGIDTALMMPSIMSGSLIRDTPPWARMSAGTRSSAITATAPASSAILACSAVTTSMMTPPLSISAMPRFTPAVPVCSVSLVTVCLLMPVASLFGSPDDWTRWGHPRVLGCPPAYVSEAFGAHRRLLCENRRRRVVAIHRARPRRAPGQPQQSDPPARPEGQRGRDSVVVEPTCQLDPGTAGGQLVDQRRQVGIVAQQPDRVLVAEDRPQRLREHRLRGLDLGGPRVPGVVRGVEQQQPARRGERVRGRQLERRSRPAQQLPVEGSACDVDAVVDPVE